MHDIADMFSFTDRFYTVGNNMAAEGILVDIGGSNVQSTDLYANEAEKSEDVLMTAKLQKEVNKKTFAGTILF